MGCSHQHVLLVLLWLVVSSHTTFAQPNYNLYAGGAGYALYFDGDQSNIATFSLEGRQAGGEATQLTIELWVKLRDPYQDEHAIFAYSAYDPTVSPEINSPTELALSYNTEQGRLFAITRDNRDFCGATKCPVFQTAMTDWKHLAMTWQATTVRNTTRVGNQAPVTVVTTTYTKRLYVDAVEVFSVVDQSTTHNKIIPNGQFAIGQQPAYFLGGYSELRSLTGIVDEFRIWGRARTPAQIREFYKMEVNPAASPGLIAYLQFNEPELIDVYDRNQWDCCIPVSENKAPGSSVQDLTIGRTRSDINKLVFETQRSDEVPKRPRFVFSDVPLEGATSQDNYRMPADYSDIIIKFQFKCIPTEDFSCDHLTVWLLHDFDEFAGTTAATPHETVRFVPSNSGNMIRQGGSLLQVGPDGQAVGELGISLVQEFEGFGSTKSIGIDEQGQPFGPFNYVITRPATQVFNNSEHGYAIIYRAEAFTEFWNEKRLIQDKLRWVVYAAPKLNLTDYPTQGIDWGDRISAPATVSIQNDFTTNGYRRGTRAGPQLTERVLDVVEDTLTYVQHSTVNDFGDYFNCTISSVPVQGRMFEVKFKEGMPEVYSNLETDIAKLTPILQSPFVITNPRCVVLYLPPTEQFGEFRDAWQYFLTRVDNGVTQRTGEGNVIVNIVPVNDPPNEFPEQVKNQICSDTINSASYCIVNMDESVTGPELSIKLNSTDIDGSPVQNRAAGDQRNYYTIVDFPFMGELFQQANEHGDRGDLVNQKPVLIAMSNAFEVVGGSSQRTVCEDNDCRIPSECAATGCTLTDFHLSNIVGEPSEKLLLDRTAFFSEQDLFVLGSSNEFVEVSIAPGDGTSLFLDMLQIYEASNPGAVARIRIAHTYNGTATRWRTIGAYEPDLDAPGQYKDGRIWQPSICPVPTPAAFVRLEVARWTGMSGLATEPAKTGTQLRAPSYDALGMMGKVSVPAGMVTYEEFNSLGVLKDYGRVVYRPVRGVHASGVFDRFSYKTSDCDAESATPMEVVLRLNGPKDAEDYCVGIDEDGNFVWPGGANNNTCISEWMDYAAAFGYASAQTNFVTDPDNPLISYQEYFIQPDTTDTVWVPVSETSRQLFYRFGILSQEDLCNQYLTGPGPVVSVLLMGTKNRDMSTFFYPMRTRTTGELYPYEGEVVLPNGRLVDADVGARTGFNCTGIPSGQFDFNTRFAFGIKTQAALQGHVPFFVDSWVTIQPTNDAVGYYYMRIRQKLLQMCTLNRTHVHYFNRTSDLNVWLSSGVVLPRKSYNESGLCQDCFCNITLGLEAGCDPLPAYFDEDQFCQPCHRLSDERVASIVADVYEAVHFRQMCSSLFEECEAGQFFDADLFRRTGSLALSCKPCPPGSFKAQSSRDLQCDLCPEGTYFASTGATRCIPCREFFEPGYASYKGQSECTRCPRVCLRYNAHGLCEIWEPYTVQLNQSNALAGRFRTDCVCKPGYFSPERQVGEVCDECVEGGYCSGGLDLPVPCGLAVFDNDTIKSQTSDWEWQCVSEDGGYFGTGGTIFFSCEGNHCLGGEENKCSEGHAGRLCAQCQDGWFSIGDMDCYECPGGKGSNTSNVVILMGILLVVASWYALGVLVSNRYDAVDIILLYMQVLALINNFSINWPRDKPSVASNLHNWLHMFLDLVNFDVDFLQPTCLLDWDYSSSFYMQMIFPVMMAAIAFVRYVYALLCTTVFFKDMDYHTIRSPLYSRFLKYFDFTKDEETLAYMLDSSVATFLQFSLINYNILCEKSFQVFECTDAGNGVHFLTAGPEITCYGAKHYGMLFIGSMSLLVNIAGIPIFLFVIIKWAQASDILNQKRFLRAFGCMYTRYETEFIWWESFLVLRRLTIVLCSVFLMETPYMQSSVAVGFMTLQMGAHFYARPFRQTQLDLLESVALIQTILYLVCGILFESQPRFNVEEYDSLVSGEYLSVIALCTCLLVLALGFMLCIGEILDVRDSKIAMSCIEDRLVEALEGIGLAYQILGQNDQGESKTGVLTADMFRKRILTLDPDLPDRVIMDLYYAIDDDNSGTVDITEFRNHLWVRRQNAVRTLAAMELSVVGRFQRYLTEMWSEAVELVKHYGRPIYKSLFKKKGTKRDLENPKYMLKRLRLKMKARMTAQVKKLNILLCGEVYNIFTGYNLRFFIENTMSDRAIIRYHQVDQWMSAAVSNDSEIGMFASNTLTNFFRPLVEAMPFILDWLVTASEADRFHFRKIFHSMFRCYEMVGRKGHYSKYIRSGHRPAVCIWLKDCSEEQQVVFWEMMHALAASNTVTDDEADKVAILRPYGLEGEVERFSKGESVKDELKVHYEGSNKGLTFDFANDGDGVKVALPEKATGLDTSFHDVKIVGEAKVGKLLVAAGEMPPGVQRCKFQWFRVRQRPDGSTAMEKIPMLNAPHYTVVRADVGCKLRMVVRPYFADGKAGKVTTAITSTAVDE